MKSLEEVRSSFARGPHATIDVGHSRLAYWRFGQGPDVVFVHGWPLHSATFRKLIPELAKEFRCHLFDLPGAGLTESNPNAPIGLVEHGETVRRAVEVLGLERFAYLAHDSGAAFARLAAADSPRVAGLVLGNTEIPGHRPWLVELYAALTKIPGASGLIARSMSIGAVRRSGLGFGGCFEDPATVDGDFGDLFVRPMLERPDILRGQMALLRHLDFSVVDRLDQVHARIAAPTLLIWGSDDRFFPIHKARRVLHQFGGGAELAEIPRARLFAHEDHPKEFLAFAAPFLRRCLRAEEIGAQLTPSQ